MRFYPEALRFYLGNDEGGCKDLNHRGMVQDPCISRLCWWFKKRITRREVGGEVGTGGHMYTCGWFTGGKKKKSTIL